MHSGPVGRSQPFIFARRRDPHAPLLVLLHVDGADARTSLAFGRALWPGALMLRLRGATPFEAGWRFLRCTPTDLADWQHERDGLADIAATIEEVAHRREPTLVEVVLIGVDGGADAAIGVLCTQKARVTAAILVRPLRCWTACPADALRSVGGMEVLLIVDGTQRHAAANAEAVLGQCGADMHVDHYQKGMEFEIARRWLWLQLRGSDHG